MMNTKSVRPVVRGTTDLMAEPIPHPKRPPCTPSRHSSCFASGGRAAGQRPIILILSGADTVAHHFNAICGGGGGQVYAVGPVRPPHSAPNTNYHLIGW